MVCKATCGKFQANGPLARKWRRHYAMLRPYGLMNDITGADHLRGMPVGM